nr:hypothetical protein [Candidatus Mycoplasma haematolamae]
MEGKNSSVKQDLEVLFKEYPGLKGFAKKIIEGYEKRQCTYDQNKVEMTCPN